MSPDRAAPMALSPVSPLAAGDFRGAGSDPTRPGLSGRGRARAPAGYNNTAVASRPGTRPHHQ